MVFFGIFGSGNLLRDGERTSSEPGDTEETATTQVPVTTEQTAGEETHTTSDAQMTVLDVRSGGVHVPQIWAGRACQGHDA